MPLFPTDQDDTLASTHNGEVIHALGGNDFITGHHGRLSLYGDAGNDSLQSGGGGSFYGGDGDDNFYLSTTVNTLIEGGKGADVIEVVGFDQIHSLAALSFAGSAVAVRVYLDANGSGYGTAGDAKGDVYHGLFGRVLGSAGDDWITDTTGLSSQFGAESQRFNGGAGNDRLVLGLGNDTGLGGAGNDLIDGGYGDDRLLGGDGNDSLTGSVGHDTLRGGLGADNFVFIYMETGFAGAPIADRITDFNTAEGDRIDLSPIDARGGQSGLQAFAFLGTDAFTGQQGEVRYEVGARGLTLIAWTGSLQGNPDTGHFEPVYMTIFLQGVTSLTEADLIL